MRAAVGRVCGRFRGVGEGGGVGNRGVFLPRRAAAGNELHASRAGAPDPHVRRAAAVPAGGGVHLEAAQLHGDAEGGDDADEADQHHIDAVAVFIEW